MDSSRDRFERLVLPLEPELRYLALALAKQEADAQDLVQETLLKAWRAFGSFAPGTNLKAWLFTILRHAHFDRCRERKQEPLAFDPALEPATPARPAEPLPFEDALPDELRAALRSLSPAHQVLLLLCDREGLRYREIADVLGCPVGSVMSGLHNARTRLKEALLRKR